MKSGINSNPGCETYPAHFSPPVSVLRLKRTHTSGNSGSFEDEHQARGRNLRIPTSTTSTSFLIQNQIIQNVQFKQESEDNEYLLNPITSTTLDVSQPVNDCQPNPLILPFYRDLTQFTQSQQQPSLNHPQSLDRHPNLIRFSSEYSVNVIKEDQNFIHFQKLNPGRNRKPETESYKEG
jgi:hypothetical protein